MAVNNSDPSVIPGPAVTVIVLFFNHARFLHECLNSIAAQTVQEFQLIVTDDCSTDESADLIQVWLTTCRPDGIFIRHTKNAGLCKTLNEALARPRRIYQHDSHRRLLGTKQD